MLGARHRHAQARPAHGIAAAGVLFAALPARVGQGMDGDEMSAAIDAFPLHWPVGWARTEPHRRSSSGYQVTFGRARDELLRSIRLLGGHDIVISSNLPLKRDGMPYANSSEPLDAGVAVYWTQQQQPRVMACDCWAKTRDNIRAIGLAIEGLRAIERSGASQILERAFQGFAALPASTAIVRSWRDVLHLNGLPVTAADVLAAFKSRLPHCHPDTGGTNDAMVELNLARDEALKEVQS